jgi:hypothetical protein
LSSPNPQPGRTLPPAVADVINEFYNSDKASRMMPGKDFVIIKASGTKNYEQKRLVLSNLMELYAHLKSTHTENEVVFSKFATLYPKTASWLQQVEDTVCVYVHVRTSFTQHNIRQSN